MMIEVGLDARYHAGLIVRLIEACESQDTQAVSCIAAALAWEYHHNGATLYRYMHSRSRLAGM
jgi:hypothetical protein